MAVFTFSKELINDQITQSTNLWKQLRLYTVFDGAGNIAGQFFYYPKRQFLQIAGNEIDVTVISKVFKKTQYLLVDAANKERVGEYKFFSGSISYFWHDIPTLPNSTLTIDNVLFNFRRIPPDVRYTAFKTDTWGYFRFRLYAVKGDAFAEYSLKMDIPTWRTAPITNLPFTGTIETNAENRIAILAAFYLMEKEFEYEDE